MTADKIKIGERAIIHEILPSELTLNIMEMGFLPGKQISLLQRAPLQDPLAFRLENTVIALRKAEAKLIEVTLEN
ncbi:FeoA family protein [Echinicola vietnamensis]|uniref:Fe2+ transport system protein A n=1 Tax=Echinicola vietnamensis (strain DSM 17526 / LMG 23754 / KMM 6221) TaxID=926556 RepID=L0FX06_ECHVK|nr:FeoA family protein [Echinicola vietnamensis]AGA77180.1 Fe2+ transport system protein A [Echinicola vietnamensis DSM 17526]